MDSNKPEFNAVVADGIEPNKDSMHSSGRLVPLSFSEIVFNPAIMRQIEKVSEMMASGRATVPAHLQKSLGDCFAVTMQAAQWGMNPFAVAQKTHLVNGILGYEAQLINAVITAMAPTRDRLHFEWFGDWEKIIGKFVEKPSKNGGTYKCPAWNSNDEQGLGIRVWATLKNEHEPRELSLLLSQAQVRSSTLWAHDPKQQIAYLATKRWSRLYCPDVIMGVYSPDELSEIPEKNINPIPVHEENSAKIEPGDLPPYSQEQLEANLPIWKNAVLKGKNPSAIVAAISKKHTLSLDQETMILDLSDLV